MNVVMAYPYNTSGHNGTSPAGRHCGERTMTATAELTAYDRRHNQLLSCARICIQHGTMKTRWHQGGDRLFWRMGSMEVSQSWKSYTLITNPRNRLGLTDVYGIHPNENHVTFLDEEVYPELRVMRQAAWAGLHHILGDRDDHDCKSYHSGKTRTAATRQRWYLPGHTVEMAERDVRTCAARDWLQDQDWLTGKYETCFVDMTRSWDETPTTHFMVSIG